MGCIFSKIYGNHIYNIGTKHEFFGWEIAGIKFHAPIDVQIYENLIHDCTLGFWMDWQAQGTRISRNVLFDNDRDGNLEVTHGPMIWIIIYSHQNMHLIIIHREQLLFTICLWLCVQDNGS